MSKDADLLESDAREDDSAESAVGQNKPIAEDDEPKDKKSPRRQLSITVRSLVTAVVIAILVSTLGVLAWLYIGAERKLDTLARQAQDDAHAEQVALDYATNAAAMDFHDMNAWKAKLVAGTSPELRDKLTKAATSMEQLLVPLQWSSSSQPLMAKVRSETTGTYVVDSFVSVLTKTTQAPDGLQSTATYSITVESNNGWQITDVAGIAAVMPPK